MPIKLRLFLVAFLSTLALDQGSKLWAYHVLKPIYPAVVTIVPRFFELRYVENPGSAFSLVRDFAGARYGVFAFGLLALVGIGVALRRAAPAAGRFGAVLGLLAGGALGNLIDRAWLGRVIDFVVWKAGTHEWPTFNIADAALVVGLLAVVLGGTRNGVPAPSEAR